MKAAAAFRDRILARRGRRSWLVLGWLSLRSFVEDGTLQRAAALAFTTVISLIPLAVLFFSFAGILGGGDTLIAYVEEKVFPLVAPDFQAQLKQWLNDYISKTAFESGPTGVVNLAAILGLLLASLTVMLTAERIMNRIWHVKGRRSYLQKLGTFWIILTTSPFLIAFSMWAEDLLVPDGGVIHQLTEDSWVVGAIYGFLMPVTLGVIAFGTIYVFLPATRVRLRSGIAGALVAALLWEVSRRSFVIYIGRSAHITSFYPKLAAVPLFLIWIYINWMIVLFGAIFSYTHQNSGRVLSEAKGPPKYSRVYMGLHILTRLGEAFSKGRESPTIERLAEELTVATKDLAPVVEILVAQGLVVENRNLPGSLTLGRSAETIVLEDIALTLLRSEFPDEAGLAAADPPGGPGLEDLACRSWRGFLASLEGRTLHDASSR